MTGSHRNTVRLQAIVFTTTAILFNTTTHSAPVTTAGSVRIAVLSDLTGSATANGTPMVTPTSLDPLIACVIEQGGVLAVTTVRDRAEGGLLRLSLDAPQTAPVRPSLDRVPLFQQAPILQKYLRDLDVWKDADARRTQVVQAKLRDFRGQLSATLLGVRRDTRSDVVGAIRRIDRFLMEPANAGRHLLLAASDLQHTAEGPARYTMAAQAVTAWVYRSDVAVKQIVLPPSTTMFEGLDAALEFLHQQCH
jgi:hypothetical protein